MNPLPRISAIVASAGTGKTTRIVKDIASEVEFRDPEQIVATTFTVKAADEIIERARAQLFSMGRANQAARLLGARFGTVNSVCAQIVAEHAFELERSPEMGVVPEDGGARLLRTAAVAVFEHYARDLNAIGERFGHEEPRAFGERPDWRNHVLRVIELGRANGLDPDGVRLSGERSLRSLEALLAPLDASTAADLDQALRQALERAVALLDDDLSKTAIKCIELMRRSARILRGGEPLIWTDWARLTKIGAAKKDGPVVNSAFDAVAAAASAHPRHPRLREDLASYIRDVFACAAESLAAFQRFKAERGLLDFIDQETLALQVLRGPDSRARLGERIGRVFVDEFQELEPATARDLHGAGRHGRGEHLGRRPQTSDLRLPQRRQHADAGRVRRRAHCGRPSTADVVRILAQPRGHRALRQRGLWPCFRRNGLAREGPRFHTDAPRRSWLRAPAARGLAAGGLGRGATRRARRAGTRDPW